MARWHLEDIENALNRIGSTIERRIEPNEKELFIGGWIIKRSSERMVDFNGIFDELGRIISDPSPEKAYGCEIRETGISLYFHKKGNKWNESLEKFINELKELS